MKNTDKDESNDKNKSDLLGSQLSINTFCIDDRPYYFVGIITEGVKPVFTRASVIRSITAYDDSDYIFDKLLPILNVDFVKIGAITALPFPIKYLNEWIQGF